MPQGKGTYGKTRGRPPMKKKGKMSAAYWANKVKW